MEAISDRLVALMFGIIVLVYLLHLLSDKKLFGKIGAEITKMVLDLFKGMFKGLKSSIAPPNNRPNRQRRGRGRHRNRRHRHN